MQSLAGRDELELLEFLWSAELDKLTWLDLPALYDEMGSQSCLGFLLIWRLRGGTEENGPADSVGLYLVFLYHMWRACSTVIFYATSL